MALAGRASSDVIPPEEVAEWVEGNRLGLYLGLVLAVSVTYDAGELHVCFQGS